MPKQLISDQQLLSILEIARLAPSVHNTQPWLVKRTSEGLDVLVDERHIVEAGDPTGRGTAMGIGMFGEAICLASESIGLKIKKIRYSNDVLHIDYSTDSVAANPSLVEGMNKRSTDRSIFKKIEISNKSEKKIKKAWHSQNVQIHVIDNQNFIEKLADLTAKGMSLALSNPDFRKELSEYLVLPWSNKQRGIAIKSLYIPSFLAVLEPFVLRAGLNMGKEATLEKKRWQSASAVVLITSEGDLHNDWFESGRAYMRASLVIEELGLSQATSAATVEASTFHEDIEKMLGTKQRLQAVLRIGKGSNRRQYSPRVSAKDLITSN